jgi:hypothetical protein
MVYCSQEPAWVALVWNGAPSVGVPNPPPLTPVRKCPSGVWTVTQTDIAPGGIVACGFRFPAHGAMTIFQCSHALSVAASVWAGCPAPPIPPPLLAVRSCPLAVCNVNWSETPGETQPSRNVSFRVGTLRSVRSALFVPPIPPPLTAVTNCPPMVCMPVVIWMQFLSWLLQSG